MPQTSGRSGRYQISPSSPSYWLVAHRLLKYLTLNSLLPRFQSAYRPHHSVDTAIVKVLADILLAIDTGDLACLALLDLSAAFDTVDHDVLLQRLSITYGIDGMAWMRYRSYMSVQSQYVRVRTGLSSTALMRYGVPQGSVLGPILFLLYTADLAKLVESHGLHVHMYAVRRHRLISCSCECRPASMMLLIGCHQTGYSLVLINTATESAA